MNKRKRVAALKHRLRRKKYEVLRKAALLAGTAPVQQVRRAARPKLISTPLQEAVTTPTRRTRRAPARETGVAEPAPTAEAVVETPAPASRSRRSTAKQTDEAPAKPSTPAKRTRRKTSAKGSKSDDTTTVADGSSDSSSS